MPAGPSAERKALDAKTRAFQRQVGALEEKARAAWYSGSKAVHAWRRAEASAASAWTAVEECARRYRTLLTAHKAADLPPPRGILFFSMLVLLLFLSPA